MIFSLPVSKSQSHSLSLSFSVVSKDKNWSYSLRCNRKKRFSFISPQTGFLKRVTLTSFFSSLRPAIYSTLVILFSEAFSFTRLTQNRSGIRDSTRLQEILRSVSFPRFSSKVMSLILLFLTFNISSFRQASIPCRSVSPLFTQTSCFMFSAVPRFFYCFSCVLINVLQHVVIEAV